MNKRKIDKMVTAHWKYIYDLLMAHREDPDIIDKINFHYTTAFIHGYGHGYEDAMKEIFGNR